MDSLTEELVKECHACSLTDKSKKTRKTPLELVQVPTNPWDKLGLDIIGPIHVAG